MPAPSGESDQDLAPDAVLQIDLEIDNDGNRLLELQPYVRSIPGGWSITDGLDSLIIPAGLTTTVSLMLEGNGAAVSGDLEIRFATEDGFSFDWNRTLNVLSGAIPVLEFYQIALPTNLPMALPSGCPLHPTLRNRLCLPLSPPMNLHSRIVLNIKLDLPMALLPLLPLNLSMLSSPELPPPGSSHDPSLILPRGFHLNSPLVFPRNLH